MNQKSRRRAKQEDNDGADSQTPESVSAPRPRGRFDFWLILLLAVIVRAIYLFDYIASPYMGFFQADQRLYWDWGVTLAQGDWLGDAVFTQGPLYPYFLGALFSINGPWEQPVLVIQLIAGVATCLLSFVCARRMFDRPTALVAGVLVSIYGPLVFYECMVLKTFLSPLLTVLALWSALRYRDHRNGWWIMLAGASVGLACLVRENHALMLLPLTWWCWYVQRTAEAGAGSNKRSWLLHAAALFFAAAAMIAPCTARNAWVGDEFVAVTSGGGEVFYLAQGPYATGYYSAPPFIRGDPLFEHDDFRREASRRAGHPLSAGESSRFWFRESARLVFANPARALGLSFKKTMILLNDYEPPDSEDYQTAQNVLMLLAFLPSFGIVCGLGVVGCVVAARRTEFWLPLALLLCHALTVILLFNYARFRMGMMPIWILLASYGLFWLLRKIREQGADLSWGVITAAVAAMMLSVLSYLPPIGFEQTNYKAESQAFLEMLTQRHERMLQIADLRELAGRDGEGQTGARMNLAKALAEIGEADGAERIYSQILEANPDHVAARSAWAEVKLVRGQIEKGLTLYKKAVGFDENRADDHVALAGVLERVRRVYLAMERHRRAIELDPDHEVAHYSLGVLLAQQQQNDEAIEQYQIVLKLNPQHADAHNNLAAQFIKKGKHDEAFRHLQEALRINPEHEFAKRNLEALLSQ